MASEITVQTIKGPTSGANANKVIIPSGQTLDASAGFTPPAGHVIQTVSKTMNGRDSITSSSFTATSFFHSITPTSSSSKILVMFMTGLNTQATSRDGELTVYRDSTELSGQTHGFAYIKGDNSRIQIPVHLSYLDSPNTTSSVTYRVYAKSGTGGNIEVPVTSSEITTITLMEIAG